MRTKWNEQKIGKLVDWMQSGQILEELDLVKDGKTTVKAIISAGYKHHKFGISGSGDKQTILISHLNFTHSGIKAIRLPESDTEPLEAVVDDKVIEPDANDAPRAPMEDAVLEKIKQVPTQVGITLKIKQTPAQAVVPLKITDEDAGLDLRTRLQSEHDGLSMILQSKINVAIATMSSIEIRNLINVVDIEIDAGSEIIKDEYLAGVISEMNGN